MLIKTIKYLLGLVLSLLVIAVGYLTIITWLFDPEVMPENYGKVDTKLYAQENKVQPLVVYFGGSEGGNSMAKSHNQQERELYTNAGYAMLAMGYFAMEGLPKRLDRISLKAIHAEIKRVQQLNYIDDNCVAVVGGSKGAELALALASKFDDIDAAVSLAGTHVTFSSISFAANGRTGSFSYNGQSLPYVNVPYEAIPYMLMGDFRTAHELALQDEKAATKAAIAVENINGPVLLISGEHDQVWPSAEMSAEVVSRLRANEFTHPYEHVMVPEGNHFQPQSDYHAKVISFLNTHFLKKCDGISRG